MSIWVAIPRENLPPPGGRALLRTAQRSIALFDTAQGIRAMEDSCPHNGASLVGGKVEDGAVQCPAHGLRFDLATGCLRNVPGLQVPTYAIRVEGGHTLIELPSLEVFL